MYSINQVLILRAKVSTLKVFNIHLSPLIEFGSNYRTGTYLYVEQVLLFKQNSAMLRVRTIGIFFVVRICSAPYFFFVGTNNNSYRMMYWRFSTGKRSTTRDEAEKYLRLHEQIKNTIQPVAESRSQPSLYGWDHGC